MKARTAILWCLTPLVALCLTSCSQDSEAGLTPPPPPGVPASVTISPQGGTLASIDETLNFTAVVRDVDQDVLPGVPLNWSSSNTSVATVSTVGLVRATGNGSMTITASTGAVSGSAQIMVQQAVASMTVTPGAAAIAVGASTTLSAMPRDANGNVVAGASVNWTTGNASIAAVDSGGTVTGVSAGGTTITATSDGQSHGASITVTGGGSPTILFQDPFEDTNFSARGWYDIGGMFLSTSEAHSGNSSLEFHLAQGASNPAGRGARLLFNDSETIYLSYWVKYSANWVGSGDPFHPHEFQFVTNEDGQYVGPAFTNLTVLVEHNYQNGGIPVIAATDGANIDVNAVGQDLSGVTEDRSAHGCNGNTDGYPTDCYAFGAGTYNNGKAFRAAQPTFLETQGAGYKNDWNFVEAYIQLNTIQGGIGQTDGVVQYWFNGQLVIDHQNVLLRTGTHPTMAFNQFLVLPFIGSGSPVAQTMWIDDLTIATGR